MGAEPLVWILWRRRKGDLDQMLRLVQALGWRYEIKKLSFRSPGIPALAQLLVKPPSDPLVPPWPDLILCAEALPSIIARRLKANSHGAIKIVCVGRPAGTPSVFDLVITTAQYRLPPATNIVELPMPLSAVKFERSSLAGDNGARRPVIALLAGGSSFPDILDCSAARHMMAQVHRYTEQRRGALVVVTSPRTDQIVANLLAETVKAPHRLHVFGCGENHYEQTLAAADEIIVTSDSVSMAADALATGKPVYVYPLPRKLHLRWQLVEWLYRHAVVRRAPWLGPMRWLFDAGVIESSADRGLLFSQLVGERRLSWFGGAPPVPHPEAATRGLEKAVQSLRAIIA